MEIQKGIKNLITAKNFKLKHYFKQTQTNLKKMQKNVKLKNLQNQDLHINVTKNFVWKHFQTNKRKGHYAEYLDQKSNGLNWFMKIIKKIYYRNWKLRAKIKNTIWKVLINNIAMREKNAEITKHFSQML